MNVPKWNMKELRVPWILTLSRCPQPCTISPTRSEDVLTKIKQYTVVYLQNSVCLWQIYFAPKYKKDCLIEIIQGRNGGNNSNLPDEKYFFC